MNINKKLDRVKQWAGEKMGAESKTNVSEEFKALEMEMQLRYEGMFALHIPGRTVANRRRYGKAPKVHDHLRQVSLEAQRSRGQGEDTASRISGSDYDTPWRGFRA
jgi:BAR domain